IFCDLNVPPSRRDKIPVLYNSDGILCVPGYRMRDGLNKAKPCAYLTILIDKSKEKRFYLADEWS
ncbi:MAG: hypothetical protein IIX96_00240, partial [Clostridia bacterium]|nr:hypothetical protein [Clostridia bacterium]